MRLVYALCPILCALLKVVATHRIRQSTAPMEWQTCMIKQRSPASEDSVHLEQIEMNAIRIAKSLLQPHNSHHILIERSIRHNLQTKNEKLKPLQMRTKKNEIFRLIARYRRWSASFTIFFVFSFYCIDCFFTRIQCCVHTLVFIFQNYLFIFLFTLLTRTLLFSFHEFSEYFITEMVCVHWIPFLR